MSGNLLKAVVYIYIYIYKWGGLHDVKTKVLDCGLKVSEFEFQSHILSVML